MIPDSLSQTPEAPSSMVGAISDSTSALGQQQALPPASASHMRGLPITKCPRCHRVVGVQPSGKLYRHALPPMQRRWPKLHEACPGVA